MSSEVPQRIHHQGAHRVAVVGLGHVGAPLAVAMAGERVVTVQGVDHDAERCADLAAGRGVEPALAPHLGRVLREGALSLSVVLEGEYEAIVVAIEPHDVTRLSALVMQTLDHLEPSGVLIIASTCRPQWFSLIVEACSARGMTPGADFHLVHAPERMMPGQALDEVVGLPRVVGGYTDECVRVAARYYERFVRGEVRGVSLEEAALIKIAENAYRAINVVLANELADVAAQYGLSASRLIAHANTHPRVDLHTPGAGAWGRCLPLAMELLAQEGSALAHAATRLNEARPTAIIEDLLSRLEAITHPVVVVCGVAYKRDLSDARNSAGTHIVRALRERGCEARIVDPCVQDAAHWNLEEACEGAHGVVYTVAHSAFSSHVLEEVRARLVSPAIVVDAAGVFQET